MVVSAHSFSLFTSYLVGSLTNYIGSGGKLWFNKQYSGEMIWIIIVGFYLKQ